MARRNDPVYQTGVPSAILRFGGGIPTIITGVRTFDHWRLLRHHPELGNAPYNQHTISAQYAAAVASVFCFVWCILSFLPAGYGSANIVFFIGCVDFAFATVFIVSSVLQGAYIPHTRGTCQIAEYWQVPDGTPSFFQAIANFSHNDDSAEVICNEYLTTWCLLVAIAVIWGLSAAFSLWLGGYYSRWKTYKFRYLWIAPINILRLLCCPLQPFFPRFYYTWRYSVKRLRKIRYRYEYSIKFQFWPKIRRRLHGDVGLAKILAPDPPVERTELSEKAPNAKPKGGKGHYDILELISRELHHIDIINLSLVSKGVHRAIFPSPVQGHRSERLRLYTCDDSKRSICWACNTQICQSCKKSTHCRPTKSSLHLSRCRAYCSPCFQEGINSRKLKQGACECIIRTFNPSFQSSSYFTYNWTIFPKLFQNGVPKPKREICRSCDALEEDELIARQDRRDADTIRQLASQSLTCEKCQLVLPDKGPRWWICKDCIRECQCGVHPPWASGDGNV